MASLVAGGVLYLNRPKSLAVQSFAPSESRVTEDSQAQPAVWDIAHTEERTIACAKPAADSFPRQGGPSISHKTILDKSFVVQTVDTLVSPQVSYEQKRSAWKQLRDGGHLDQAIGELEQRMTADPRGADNAAALGHAYLQKCGTIQDVREQGILAMQADKVFDTALNLDPSNWEARYMKAVALSYWPASMNKGQEVIDHFQTLLEQQEARTSQPEFAETYVHLGEQYEKSGRSDEAKATWERGLLLFPQSEGLKKKLVTAQ
jgi:tetratricopeptide (TPR) repeat protein